MTSIAATVVHATSTVPPHVTVAVTSAPNPPASQYTANFATTVDGFTYGGGAGGSVAWDPTYHALVIQSPVDDVFGTYYAERTVTGLSVGVVYTFTATVSQGGSGTRTKEQAKLTVRTTGGTEIAATSYVLPPALTDAATISIAFTASATSHVIRVYTTGLTPAYTSGTALALYVRSAKVASNAWLGTRVYRTDDNGTNVLVRLAPGQDTVGGAMTVTDWEAALTGTVIYNVIDGIGATWPGTNCTFAPTAGVEAVDGLWLTKPETADPSAGAGGSPDAAPGLSIIAYRAHRTTTGQLQQIIDRADKAGNPGIMTARSGSLTILCQDYAQALTIEALLDNGTAFRLLQTKYPGMDMLAIGTADAAEMIPGIDKWTLAIDYEEQLAETP